MDLDLNLKSLKFKNNPFYLFVKKLKVFNRFLLIHQKMCKTCTKCSRELPLESFNRNKRRKKDGRENKCRECTNTEKQEPARREVNLKAQKNWRENNKDYQTKWRKDNLEHVEYRKKYYEEHKDEYIKRKGCGEKIIHLVKLKQEKNMLKKTKMK